MCITYRFSHLCGHTHRVATFPCTFTYTLLSLYPLLEDEVLSYPEPRLACGPHTCLSDPAGSPEETRLFPTLCATCEQVGIISEWLNRTPGGRVEVIQAWNTIRRAEPRQQPNLGNEITELASYADAAIGPAPGRGTVKIQSADDADDSSTANTFDSVSQASPVSSSERTTTDLSSLRQRLQALKSRVCQRITELKTVTVNPDAERVRVLMD